MAAASFEAALAVVLAHEGGYVDHPSDPGGATNRGITRATLAGWRGRPVSKAEVRALGRDEAAAIYRARYWNAVRGDDLPAGLDLAVFDFAVNAGPGRAIRTLQQVLGVRQDGAIGPQTLAACQADSALLIRALGVARLAFHRRLPTFATFGKGWTRRIRAVEREALALASPPAAGRRPWPVRPPLSPAADPAASASSNTEEFAFMQPKHPLQSRTVWANLVGLVALALPAFGVNAATLEVAPVVDSIMQVIVGASFLASTGFRLAARRPIKLP
jgi:lysozyme family protein